MTHESTPAVHPELTADEQLKAAQFTAQHLYTPLEYRQDYHERRIADWGSSVVNGNRQPMWLRRSFEDTDEFSAVVDYCIFDTDGKQLTYASLDFDGSGGARDITVLLPDAEGHPSAVATFPFDLVGTARALAQVETAFA